MYVATLDDSVHTDEPPDTAAPLTYNEVQFKEPLTYKFFIEPDIYVLPVENYQQFIYSENWGFGSEHFPRVKIP